jgi:O-antigen ligase
MAPAKSKIKTPDGNRVNLILSGAVLITLLFWTPAKDPFNVVKLWLLVLFGSYLLGQLIANIADRSKREIMKNLRLPYLAVGSFVLLAFVASLLTDFKYTAFIGEGQRNTGFIAYFFLAVFFLVALTDMSLKYAEKIFIFAISLLVLMTGYGVMQHFGKDFVKWNNPYNSIISTVGNPDFAGAMMSILLVLAVASIFATKWSVPVKVGAGVLALTTLVVIKWSNALQGLTSFLVGISVFGIIWLWQQKKILGQISLALAIPTFILAFLGILQKGPLTHLLYKSSVTVRGYYWHAGAAMFKAHPWFGVGMDRYGAYFRQFRNRQYPVNYGYDITSTAAHNVIIQIFATCGIFVGITYLSISGLVIYSAIKGMRANQGQARLLIAGVFAAWVAYLMQSIVSIDNIGIAIWGWVLGGAVIGISRIKPAAKSEVLDVKQERGRQVVKKQSSFTYAQPIISGALALIAFLFVLNFYGAETGAQNIGRYAIPQNAQDKTAYHSLIMKNINAGLLNPNYKAEEAVKLAQSGFVNESFSYLDSMIKADKQSYTATSIEADFYEQLHQPAKAIVARLQMERMDPWGAASLLKLGQDYIAVGDKASAKAIGQKIIAMRARPDVVASAHTQLGA